jgi:hypothetical protein
MFGSQTQCCSLLERDRDRQRDRQRDRHVEKSFIAFKDTWFKVQMLFYTILDSCFLASDTELVNKYSYTETRPRIEQYLTAKSDSGDPVSDEYAAPLL